MAAASGDWRVLLLGALRAPSTTVNLDALAWWQQSEGTPPSWNNWLATTWSGYGGRDVNSAGVKAYPTVGDGVAATAATLYLSPYHAVITALRTGTSTEEIWAAINQSPWCAHCQGGRYPVAIWDHIPSGAPAPQVSIAPPATAPGGGTPQYRAVAAWDDVRTALYRTANQQLSRMSQATAQIRRSRR